MRFHTSDGRGPNPYQVTLSEKGAISSQANRCSSDAIKHGAFDQREGADCRAVIEVVERTTGRFLRNALSAWALMQPSMAGRRTFSASTISPATTIFCGLNRLMAMAIVFPGGAPRTQSPRRPGHRPCLAALQIVLIVQVIRRQTALVALLQQVANPLFNGGIGATVSDSRSCRSGSAFAQRVDLNMANFADVAVAGR